MKPLLSHRFPISPLWSGLLLALLYLNVHDVLRAEESASPTTSHVVDMRFSTTTFLLNLEKRGLEDNTFTNGLGRDTTLIGNLINATLYKRLLPSLEAEIGVFANMPFGHDHEISQVRPVVRLTYQPVEQITAVAGTIRTPHRDFHDAVFDNGNRFLRPIEQGAQMLVDSTHYQQDLFINWEQAFRGSAPNRYDVGYAGQLKFGPLHFNGQAHWVRNGQALFKLDRSFSTRDNLVVATGPELVLEPSRWFASTAWWHQIGISFTYLTSYNQADNGSDASRGRGYELRTWLDLAGWRPYLAFWKGRNFLSQQGDPEFRASNFPEFGLSKTIRLGKRASIEFGAQARRIRAFFTEDGLNYMNRDTFKWVNQEYLVFNWDWDTNHADLIGDVWASLSRPFDDRQDAPSERRFTAKLDTLTYVYSISYHGVRQIGGIPVSNHTFAGQYLSPVLQYRVSPQLTLDAGLFAGLPVGDTQSFHTVQPILSAQYEMVPDVRLVAGTLHRNHPFVDALFNDATLFSRPVEQGFQLLVDREHYQQDLFINWNQIETYQKAERFDVGYAGRVAAGPFALNGQVYWTHFGGAQYSEARTFFGPGLPRDRPAGNNFLTAFGPQFTWQPKQYWPQLSWFREIDVMALYLTSQNEPTQSSSPIVRGRGYQLTAGVNLDGWRPYITLWRGEHFVTERGDPAYYAGDFTEFGLFKDFILPAGFSLRLGGFGRTIERHLTHTEYALLNWSWDQTPWRGFCQRPTLLHRSESSCGQS
ncbi:MAG TPA: hypothetical protein PLY42_13955 [Nitrospira sp.]|nr:hypothetical protein [Nitrospira sp.]HMU30819.1 hypothetical protein [Nitrospira sp.]HMV59077.1 hypothetical protein [Nitrospira sp.]HMW84374.1 hypothetical protein [Nitrospira sp.]HMX92474.1 hypothetical protein [Nitrospira sp.]